MTEPPFFAMPTTNNKAKTFAIVALAVVGTFAACYAVLGTPAETDFVNPTALKDLYTHWKQANNLTYGGPEDEHRFGVFSNNYKKILRHNAKTHETYKLGLNKFAAMTREEFASTHLGLHAHKKAHVAHRKFAAHHDAAPAPAAVDWTTQGAVTGVKDQGQCGSCWSFSTTGALEGLNAIKNGKLVSFSEQQLVDCSGSYGNEGCNGGLMDDAFQYVAAEGIVTEASYPYKAADGKCKIPAGDRFKNTGFTDVKVNDPNALKAAIAQQPVSVAIEADQDAFQLYNGGVITGSACGTQLDHGVLAVGYGVDGKTEFFKVKNSWGGSWGEAGYVRIGVAKGAGVCGIQSAASFPTL
jgi:C1A family cysteine protease